MKMGAFFYLSALYSTHHLEIVPIFLLKYQIRKVHILTTFT